jgi:glutamate--cysteine ligase
LNRSIESRLNRLVSSGQQHLLKGGLKGLEKESLRITAQGRIAQTPHPAALGSALTHPFITTDYSEALIELITPPFADVADTLQFLEDLHQFVYDNLEDELLLATSMPCEIEGDQSIPIAVYGTSNIGRMKHLYRRGLAYRYGRAMQAIAGIHFNYSINEAFWPVYQALLGNSEPLDQFIADQYFGLIRNTHRYGWLILYLFGSSPALCKSFFAGREPRTGGFSEFDARTLYRPYATSLRMSDIGYRNDSQATLDISFNNLGEYVASLSKAIGTPYADYEKIGVKVGGEYRQLNANILQIENEYYSAIRPKQIAGSGEKPTLALKRRGIRYVELRSVDLGCYDRVGGNLPQLRFLELFLLCCLLEESPPLTPEEKKETGDNSLGVACCGRTPGFTLRRGGREIRLRDWALEFSKTLHAVAEILDEGERGRPYGKGLDGLFNAIADPETTPSARVLAEMRERGESFQDFALRLSRWHASGFRGRNLAGERAAEFRREAEESLREQQRIEAGDALDFDEFLQKYFAQA